MTPFWAAYGSDILEFARICLQAHWHFIDDEVLQLSSADMTSNSCGRSPWLRLPERPPFVLEQDLAGILRYNQKSGLRFGFDLRLHPEPFIGSLSAPVILLALNPGLSEADYLVHADKALLRIIRDSALQASSCSEHYYLSDPFRATPGGEWWREKLRCLLEDVGRDVVSRAICCIQLYPYHSKEFGSIPEVTSTLEYVREVLVRQILQEKLIVVMRAWERWTKCVPELHSYERVLRLRNPRNPCLSPGNLGGAYETLVQSIRVG